MSAEISKSPVQQDKSTPQAEQSKGRSQRLLILAGGAVIIVAGLLAYHNSFSGPFIFDDKTSISENSHIRQLWPIWHVFRAQPGATASGRPVLSLSLALNYQISGLEVWSYHAVNLAVHILAALTLFGIVRRTLLCEKLRARFGKTSFSLALICALIWLLHPLQTGSVTYMVQRAESLMGLFYLLSLYCAIRGFSSAKSRPWYIAAILVCALGMGTKEVVATAPVIVLLYDRVFVSRSFKEIFARRWGLYVGLAATWIIFGSIALSAPRGSTVGFGFSGLGWLEYSMTQCKVVVSTYLKLSFWPSPLVLDYGWPIVERFGDVVPHALVLAALLIGTVLALRYYPVWGFLGVWFFVILGPSSSFVPIISEVVAEHRMYLPLAAVVVAVVLGGYLILSRLAISDRRRARLGCILAGVVIVILGSLTFSRNNDYSSELLIWDATIVQYPNNPRAYNQRGDAYRRTGDCERAIRDFNEALKLSPSNARSFTHRGVAYVAKGDYDRGIQDFNTAIELNPEVADPYNNRGNVYRLKGDYEQAIRDFNKALDLDSNDARTYSNRGAAYSAKGEHDLGIEDFNQAIELNPRQAQAYNNRGIAYSHKGEYDRAIGDYNKAIKFNPRYADAYFNRGLAHQGKGGFEQAISDFSTVIELDPSDALAYFNKGLAYQSKGDFEQAINTATKALQLAREAKNEKLVKHIQSQLESYKAKRLYRESANPQGGKSPQAK